MLTLNHVADEQAATLAACPRPRALAAVARFHATAPSVASWPAPALPSVAARQAGIGSVAELRPWALERPAVGYLARRGMAGFGFGAASAVVGAIGDDITRTSTISTKQDEQAQQNLTHRREPRTWRPPH